MTETPRGARSLRARVKAELRAHAPLYLVWLLWSVAFFLLVRATLGGPDGSRYLAYLRSLVFDRDLVLVNELDLLGQRVISTSTGYSAQIANVGILPFWAPFYLLGMAAAWAAGDVGSGLRSNYQIWLAFGDWLYGLLALIATYDWVARRSERRIALAATLLAALGTSFAYYMTALAPSYHMVSALVCVLFLRLWDGSRQGRTGTQWFGLGLLAGMLVSIAQYHALLIVFPALDVLSEGNRLFRGPHRADWSGSAVRLLTAPLPLVPGLLLPLLPQMVVWGAVYGNPLANPYTLAADWSGARLPDVLFSSYHGLFFTAPIALLAVAGWLAGLRADWRLYAGAIAMLLGIAYSSSTRIGWWGGVSFGMRYVIGMTPLFAAGLAVLATALPTAFARPAALTGGGLCALWTYGYFLQAFTGLTSFSEYHAAEQWIAQQLTILRDPLPVLAAHWLLPRPAVLFAYLPAFLLVSLIVVRTAGARLTARANAGARPAIYLFAGVPLIFAGYLLSVIPISEARIATLKAEGYFERNRAQGEFDWEQFSNEFVERARYESITGQSNAARADLGRAIQFWQNTSRRLADSAALATFEPRNVRFGTDVELLGYRVEPPAIQPGMPVTVTLLWRADKRMPVDYDSGILLLDTRGEIVTRPGPAYGVDAFPASWWLPGVVIEDRHVLDAGAIEPATLLRVRAELFDPLANRRLPAPDNGIFAELRAPAPIGAISAAIASLGGQLTLAAYDVRRTTQGIDVRLTWQALVTPTEDYTVFVHLLDEQNRILAQSDSQPLAGRYPTHAWRPGEIIQDSRSVGLNTATQANVRRIAVGMYRLGDLQRLPASTGGDAIILTP